MEIPKAFQNRSDEFELDQPAEVMGDVVDNKTDLDNMHDQMRNELEVLRLADPSVPMRMPSIEEVEPPLTPRPDAKKMIEVAQQAAMLHNLNRPIDKKATNFEPNSVKDAAVETKTSLELSDAANNNETTQKTDEKKIKADETITAERSRKLDESSSAAESPNVDSNVVGEKQAKQIDEKTLTSDESSENPESTSPSDAPAISCVEYLKPISHDTPSSDLSDTDTTDKAEKVYTESGIDETSRDERDEVSEIENFDLSSCGEDSLEAMYYMIRKNEIIMDRHKQASAKTCDDEKITFPDKATDELEHAVREVSGKKVKLCSIGSMNSSTGDVVLKRLSSDSDELQLHVIRNSEIDSSSEPKSCPLKEQCTANESTDDEYMNPMLDSMRKNDDALNEMHAKALSVQPNRSDSQSDDQQLETDTFNEHLMDDMMPGNIERKILASSISEADSDYYDLPPTASRLTKDDFNVSTAFEHMIRTDSTTEESDSTIESAATKIQAGARGFLARRRIRKSSAGTSASNEKRSSIGNAAIDKSLDNLIEQQELQEETGYSESFDESSPQSREMWNEQTIESVDSEKIFGITEVKVEQRKDDSSVGKNTDDRNADEKVPEINIHEISEDSATAQRRLMLQRGDAMQRNDTPGSSEQHSDKEKSNNDSNNEQIVAKTEINNGNDENPKIAAATENGEFNSNL